MPHSCDILVLRTTALALERAERTRPIHGTLRFDFTVLTLARVHPCPATRRAPLGRRAKDAEATILRERAAFAELQLVEEQKMFKEIQTMKEKAQLATWAEVSQRSPLTVLVYCGNHGYTRLTSGSRVAHEWLTSGSRVPSVPTSRTVPARRNPRVSCASRACPGRRGASDRRTVSSSPRRPRRLPTAPQANTQW